MRPCVCLPAIGLRSYGFFLDRPGGLSYREACDFQYGPDFDGALARAWNAGGDADCLVEILGFDQEVAAELFAGFREWTVGDQAFAVAHLDARGRRHRLQRGGGQKLAVRLKPMHQLRGLREAALPLGLGPGLFVGVDQQHVFHSLGSIITSNGKRQDRHARPINQYNRLWPLTQRRPSKRSIAPIGAGLSLLSLGSHATSTWRKNPRRKPLPPPWTNGQ